MRIMNSNILFESIIQDNIRGVIITNEMQHENVQMLGKVISVAKEIDYIFPDDIIIFHRFVSKEISVDDKKYRLIHSSYIWGVLR